MSDDDVFGDNAAADPQLLERAAKRLVDRPGFMAEGLRIALGGEDPIDEIMAALACERAAAVRLALMRSPRKEHFAEDVTRMADAVGVDRIMLMALVRRADSLRAMGDDDDAGVLLAARDVTPRDEDR